MELEEIIKKEIMEKGPITFERFMGMALYYPELGYYCAPDTEIGRKGDFYTSPHLHPIFGMVLAKQLDECWTLLGRPEAFIVVEQGAGKGYLANDILDYLKGRDIFNCLQYMIIEINPYIKQSQQRLLKEYGEKITWAEDIEKIEQFTGCLLSNELLDALPVHLVHMDRDLKEIYVGLENNDFKEVLDDPSTDNIEGYIEEFAISLGNGYRTEINLRIRDWLSTVAEKLLNGFVISIDYGYSAREYYGEDRSVGTLMCYFRHQVNEDPFKNVGKQDMTAHVNFSSVKKWGDDAGLRSVGYAGQGIYMVSMGLDEIITERYLNSDDYQFEVARIKGLIMPGGLGESHKVMVQFKGNDDIKLRGFKIRNRIKVL